MQFVPFFFSFFGISALKRWEEWIETLSERCVLDNYCSNFVLLFFFLLRYNRLEQIKKMRWEYSSVLPSDVKYNMCEQEVKICPSHVVMVQLQYVIREVKFLLLMQSWYMMWLDRWKCVLLMQSWYNMWLDVWTRGENLSLSCSHGTICD